MDEFMGYKIPSFAMADDDHLTSVPPPVDLDGLFAHHYPGGGPGMDGYGSGMDPLGDLDNPEYDQPPQQQRSTGPSFVKREVGSDEDSDERQNRGGAGASASGSRPPKREAATAAARKRAASSMNKSKSILKGEHPEIEDKLPPLGPKSKRKKIEDPGQRLQRRFWPPPPPPPPPRARPPPPARAAPRIINDGSQGMSN
jgi:hypothetical protein